MESGRGETAMTITLKQAYEQGSLRVAFYCMRPVDHSPGYCGKVGRVDIEHLIQRWGDQKQLDEIPARCGVCRSGEYVSAMGEPPGRLGKRGNR
jgi:hypothetical protein